ncbi:MAG: DNA repair protein RadC [Porticoccus sp.]|nr:DNA repair protein RadC [Porticoccus sp.]MBQ0808397.1 DNA repair protein RadC [Porticoccus sp.]
MTIRDWPEAERPREKLLEKGASALSDAELLAIFLRTGCPGFSAVDLARELLQRFGSLGAMLSADKASFCRVRGLGTAKFVQLQAVMELARRHLGEQLQREHVFTSATRVSEFLLAQLRHCQQEVFAVLFLDTQNRLIAWEKLFFGTVDGASVHPREVVKRTLHHNAAAVIFSHNHPSGVAEPSESDRAITQRLKDALTLVDVRVLDHVIVGGGYTVSMAERGDL